MIDRCEKIINGTAFTICVLLFGGVVLFSTLFSADYVPDDSPAFSGFSYDRIFYLILAVAILGLSLLTGKLCKWNIKVCFILYGMVSLVYIIAVPLEAFSDMKIVFDIAVNGFSDPEGYLSNYPNNIPLTIYTWVLTSLFGKSIVVLKLFNILFDVVVLYFLYRLSLISEDKKMVWMAGPFIPVIIYQNHIYNDVLFTALTVVLLYAVLRKKQTAWSLVAAIILSVLQFAFRSTGIIYIIAIAMYMILYERKIRKCVIYLAVTAVLIVMLNTVNTRMFKPDPTLKFPVWSWVQMGINEEEFGFQDVGSVSCAEGDGEENNMDVVRRHLSGRKIRIWSRGCKVRGRRRQCADKVASGRGKLPCETFSGESYESAVLCLHGVGTDRSNRY